MQDDREQRAEVRDSHLYLYYWVYDYGNKLEETIIPIDRIDHIVERIGVRGGDHGFIILSKELNQYPTNDGYGEHYNKTIFSWGRGMREVLEDIKHLLPQLEIQTAVQQGSAYP